MSISVVKYSWVKCDEVERSVAMLVVVLVNKVLTLLEDIQTIGSCCLYVFCCYHIL